MEHNHMKIRAAIFDIYGTLLEVSPPPKNADALCDKGDLLLTVAHTRLLQAAMEADEAEDNKLTPENAQKTEQEIWNMYGVACENYENAYQIDPSTGIAEKLGDLCFSRSRLQMAIAKDSATGLLSDAERWYRSGLAEDNEDEELVIRLAQIMFFKEGDHQLELDLLLKRYIELGGEYDDVYEERELFEEEFLQKLSEYFPDAGYEDVDDEEDDDDDEEDDDDDDKKKDKEEL